MLYALLMLIVLAATHAAWNGASSLVPLVFLAAVATAWAFVSDITTVLSISL